MKSLFRLGLVALGLLLAQFALPSSAEAACTGTPVHGGSGHACYGIAPNSWGTSGAWSATSGGASCACTPTTGDDLIFDGHSGSGTYTASAISLNSLDASAAASTVTIAGSAAVTISGNYFVLVSTMTWTATGTYTFTSTSGTTIIELGNHTLTSMTLNGIGGTFQFGGDSLGGTISNTLTLTNGTLDASTNNPNLTIGIFGGAAGTLNCGTGTWTFVGAGGNVFSFSGTINCGSAAFTFAPSTTQTSIVTFITQGSSYGAVTFTTYNAVAKYSFAITVSAGATFASLTLNGPTALTLTGGQTLTLSATPAWTGTAAAPIWIGATTTGVNAITFAIPASPAPALSFLSMQNVTFTGNTSGVCTSCQNYGNVTGMTINAPIIGTGGGHIIGG